MTYYSNFSLGQKVIIDNEMTGIVVEIAFMEDMIALVKVSWWHNGSNTEAYYREWRLNAV